MQQGGWNQGFQNQQNQNLAQNPQNQPNYMMNQQGMQRPGGSTGMQNFDFNKISSMPSKYPR